MRSYIRQCVVVAALVCAVCTDTRATSVCIQFSGTIDYVESDLAVGSGIVPGVSFLGRYSYDSETPDNAPGDAHYGGYSFPDSHMDFGIGELDFVTPDLGLTILNQSVLDSYNVSNITPFSAHGIEWAAATITLRDLTATAFATDALPLDVPDLAKFSFARTFLMRRMDHREPSITGTITAMTLVPEPSALGLLAIGAALALRRRQKGGASRRSAAPLPAVRPEFTPRTW